MVQKLLIVLFSLFLSISYAQDRDSISSVSELNRLKQAPPKSVLPVKQPTLAIQPVHIPVSDLNLKVDYWKTWISFGLNINQAAFSDNWSAGGVNSIALGSKFNYKTDYTKGDKNYVSELILQYGKMKNKAQLERKTNDRIFWDNKVALKLSKNWNFFGSLNFESQFDSGFLYGKDALGNETRSLISRFMAPGYLTESLGFEYKPDKSFSLRIGTGTARQTFVVDTGLYRVIDKNYGVTPGKKFRNELAFQFVGNLDKNISENINLKTRYAMFANYEKLNNIDHRLDITLTSKINRLMNVSLAGIAAYDDDASGKIQASQAFSFGLSYNFPR
jgi:hypothetical protein